LTSASHEGLANVPSEAIECDLSLCSNSLVADGHSYLACKQG
jgi:hypothetical protein